MTFRETEESAVQTIDQVRILLDASAQSGREMLAAFGDYTAPTEMRVIKKMIVDLTAASLSIEQAFAALRDRLDPFGDQYDFQPPEPVQITANGLVTATTGYSSYADTVQSQYIVANVNTVVTNAASAINESQKPLDIPQLFDGERVWGLLGDGMSLRVQLDITPSDPNNIASTGLLWFTTGDPVTGSKIFPMPFTTDGYGVKKTIAYATSAYVGPTWAQSGVRLVIETDGALEVTSRSLLVGRWHKGKLL